MGKILIVAGLSRSLVRFRGDLIKEWLKLGHSVDAAAPGSDVAGELQQMGATYHSIPLKRTGLNPLEDLLLFGRLLGLLVRVKPDYLFLYTIKPVIYASLASFFLPSIKVITMITGLGYIFTGGERSKLLKYLVHWLYRLALRKSMVVFFQNPDDRDEFVNLKLVNAEKTQLINGSGVNLDYFKPAALPEPPLTFLLIARLLLDKGIIEYAEAAKIIKEKYPAVTFRLIGSFYDYPASVSKADLEEWVRSGVIDYPGSVSDVRPEIARAHVYVLPSYREGTPRSTLEAMAMGRPVITTDAPGCRETVVEGVNVFLVPVKDVQALAGAMEKFILEPELAERMGKESRRLAEEKFDVREVNSIIIKSMGL